jgi:HD-GYP domain-containing protein (c-di-GMP phosphodiesterase class II)
VSKAIADSVAQADSPFTWDGPWSSDIGLLIVRVGGSSRRRAFLVAAAVVNEKLGEDFARLCGACQLDTELMKRLARQSAGPGVKSAELVGKLLAHGASLHAELQKSRHDVQVLTHNLDSTYEELHLIYAIADEMSLRRNSHRMLERVGLKLLETCRAQGLCFVIGTEALTSNARGTTPASVRERGKDVVRVGNVLASADDVERLVREMPVAMSSERHQTLINDVSRCPELSWASPWLKHLAVFPLMQNSTPLGIMLALNCRDEGDFTTIDAHLMRTVADRLTAKLANHHLYQDLADLLMGLLHSMVNSIDAKDAYTCGHSERVAHVSRALARAAGLRTVECDRIYLAGLLHDVGKIGVADSILTKPGKLTDEEFDALKKHPEMGAKILSPVRQIQDLMPGVLHHHERMDGKGYPHGLVGENIPLMGRIICLADCFDAMTSSRTYRAALPLAGAMDEIRRCAGSQFDPRLAELFLGLDLAALLSEAQASLKDDPIPSRLASPDWATDAETEADQS